MKKWIEYDKEQMWLYIHIGKFDKLLQCPFATWWRARKYFKRPKFKFYFGPMWKYLGKKQSKFGEYDDYKYLGGYWFAASTEYLKWNVPKWFPISMYSRDIMSKDKYDTPRFERSGYFVIYFGRDYHKHWQFSIIINAPDVYCANDCTQKDIECNYWESMLWYLYYSKEYGLDDSSKRDLIKARNTLQEHWHRSKTIPISDFEIVDVHDGLLFDETYVVVSIKSEQLRDLCVSYPDFNTKRTIYFKLWKDNNICYEVGYHTRCNLDLEEPLNIVDVWVKCRDRDNFKNKLNDYDSITIECEKIIDLGPIFKDDYLNKKGIKLVKKEYGDQTQIYC